MDPYMGKGRYACVTDAWVPHNVANGTQEVEPLAQVHGGLAPAAMAVEEVISEPEPRARSR